MLEHHFTLTYQVAETDGSLDLLVERLGAGGCSDAVIGTGQPGRIGLSFTREAASADEAFESAKSDIEQVAPTAKLLEVHLHFPRSVEAGKGAAAASGFLSSSKCRACGAGALHESGASQAFFPHKKTVTVDLLASTCDSCGAGTTLSAQHDENLRRLTVRKAFYEGELMGEEYLSLRKRYGLTLEQAAAVFGESSRTWAKYENEESFPDIWTRRLVELAIALPEALETLAEKAGVAIPLWAERCEDRLLNQA